MKFTIDEQYICDVVDRREWSMFDGIPHDELTHDQLLKILRGEDRCSSTGTRDHPEFERLRSQLEAEGYIECQRGWWNGDRVLKPFYLNNWRFKKGHQFPCAAALRNSIECAKLHGWKTISHY